MKQILTDDVYMKAEIYSELINDMQAKIAEFERNHPDCVNEEIISINRQLSDARMASRIYIDETHFEKWESLILAADVAMIRHELFR